MPFPFSQWTGIFKCKDVPGNIISSLLEGLKPAGIYCSTDEITKDTSSPKEIPPETKFALVVFSEGFVNSNRRLDELVKIPRSNRRAVIIPIFYMDGVAVVGDGEFTPALQTVDEREKVAKKIQRMSALAKAEKISGRAANEPLSLERNLIDKIVGRLVNEMHSRCFGEEFTFGPFGGEGPNDPDSVDINKIDETGEERKGIAVEYEDFIKSVAFKVNRKTNFKPEHGGNDRNRTYKVRFEKNEYITSFAGSKRKTDKNGVLISSLTFRTNKRILGPIGKEKEEEKKEKKEEEEYFSVPLDAGKLTKFFWREKGNFLESVGALVQLHSEKFNPFESEELFGRESDRSPTWHMASGKKIVIRIGHSSGRPFIRLNESPYKDGDKKKTHDGRYQEEEPKIFKLDDGEYLTSISGYYTDDTDISITSLTFRTNKRMAITFGKEKGIYFSSPATAGRIVKFVGYTDGHQHLCGIGAYFEPIGDLRPSRSIGPSEGSSGDTWDYGKFGVREIVIKRCNENIHQIDFNYADGSVYTVTCGGCTTKDHLKTTTVDLKYPREYLTSVSGYMGDNDSILSLTFYSNKRIFPSGVKEGGTYFWYPLAGSRIIGFYGRVALKYIGVHVEPIPNLYPFRTVGPPMKGCGGKPWNDGVHTDVRGVRVATVLHREREIIQSITFMYDNNGSLVKGDRHGGGDASGEDWVMLDFPKDRLCRIEGYMRKENGQTFIHDLTIVPTMGKSIPYALGGSDKKWSSTPVKFSISVKDGRIVGFFGMAGNDHLNSIGAWLEPY